MQFTTAARLRPSQSRPARASSRLVARSAFTAAVMTQSEAIPPQQQQSHYGSVNDRLPEPNPPRHVVISLKQPSAVELPTPPRFQFPSALTNPIQFASDLPEAPFNIWALISVVFLICLLLTYLSQSHGTEYVRTPQMHHVSGVQNHMYHNFLDHTLEFIAFSLFFYLVYSLFQCTAS